MWTDRQLVWADQSCSDVKIGLPDTLDSTEGFFPINYDCVERVKL